MHDDFSDLDGAFTLPEIVTDPGLRLLYEHIVHRMRTEAKGVPMQLVQNLLLERCAAMYVLIKFREQHPIGSANGFKSAQHQKDQNAQWLALVEQFNKMLAKKTPEAIRTEVYQEVVEKVLKVVSKIKDENLRDALNRELLKEFQLESS